MLLASGCGGARCEPRTVTPTGDLSRDLVGTWNGFGVDTNVVGTCVADGGFFYTDVGGAGRLAGTQSWSVKDAGTLTINGQSTQTGTATITNGSFSWADGRTHSAVTCRGVAP